MKEIFVQIKFDIQHLNYFHIFYKCSLFTIFFWLVSALALPASAQLFSAQHFTYEQGLSHNQINDIAEDKQGFLWIGTYGGLSRYNGYTFDNVPLQAEKSQTHTSIQDISVDSLGNLWIIGQPGFVYRYLPRTSTYDFSVMQMTQRDNILHVYHTRTTTYLASPHTLYEFDPQAQLVRSVNIDSAEINFIFVDSQQRLWVGTTAGLTLVDDTQQYRFTHNPGNSTSMTDHVMLCMAEDHQGRLWVGARWGLNLLEDVTIYPDTAVATFQRFLHLKVPQSELRHRVSSIQEVDDHRLLIGLDDGYSFFTYTDSNLAFDPLPTVSLADQNAYQPAQGAVIDPLGNLWFSTRQQQHTLQYYPHQRLSSQPADNLSDPLKGADVSALLADTQGNVWVGTNDGLFQFNAHQKPFLALTSADGLPHNDTYSLFVDSRQWLWIGTLEGIIVLDQNFHEVLHFNNPIGPGEMAPWKLVGDFAEDAQGRILMGFYDGQLARYDVKQDQWHYWHHVAGSGLTAWSFRDVYLDKQGTIWAASASKGLVEMTDDTTYAYHSLNGQEGDESFILWSIQEDPSDENMLWLGTQGRGVIRFNKKTKKSFSLHFDTQQPDASRFLNVKNVYFDQSYRMWISSNSGLFVLDVHKNLITHLTTQDGLPSNDCQALVNDEAGNVWVSTNAGVAKVSAHLEVLQTYSQEAGLASNFFNERGAAHNADGAIFLGSKKGVVYFQPKNIRANPYPGRPLLTDFYLRGTLLEPGDTVAEQVPLPQALSYTESITLPHDLNDFGIHFTSLNFAAPSHNQFKYRLQGYDQAWKYADSKQRQASYMNLPAGEYTFALYAANGDNRWSEQPATVQIIILPPWWQTLWFRSLLLVLLLSFFLLTLYFRTRHLKEQKRQLEQTVATRTQALRKANENVQQQKDRLDYQYSLLRMLSQIGQNITASMQAEDIIQKSYTHINKLMRAPCLSVGLVDKEQNLIRYYGFYDHDSPITFDEVSLSDESRLSVWCVTHTQTVVMNDVPAEVGQYLHRSTDGYTKGHAALSSIYLPLVSYNHEVVGILIAKSFQKDCYGEQEVETLQYLANFISIALNNAVVYQHLEKLNQHKTSFFTNVSHEFKTPLTLILGPVTKILKDSPNHEEQLLLEIVHSNALRLSRLVNELLELQRVDNNSSPLVRQSFDLIAFAHHIVHLFSFATEQNNMALLLHTTLPELIISADPDKLELILYNLISNAIKYAKEATKIDIRIQQVDQQEFTLSVHDDGLGIPHHVGERIFDRFMSYDATTSTLDSGTGVGLALVKHFVELHGWQIQLNPVDAQKGTCFEITLSAVPDRLKDDHLVHTFRLTRTYVQAERPARTTATQAMTSQSNSQLLIVEDNLDLRQYLRSELQDEYRLILAEDAIAALQMLEQEEPDLIITDWMMPAMTGQEFCQKLKQNPRFDHIPIIMMTARSGEQSELASFQDGVEQYINKPFSMQVLRARIASLLLAKEKLRYKLRRDWVQQATGQLEGSPEETFVEAIKKIIEQRYTDPDYRIDSLSAEIGLSRTQLFRKCKLIMQSTPNEMLQSYRLNKSLAYLEKGYTVAEAAYAVGFNDPKYFARCFKAAYKKPPSQAILNS